MFESDFLVRTATHFITSSSKRLGSIWLLIETKPGAMSRGFSFAVKHQSVPFCSDGELKRAHIGVD